MPDRRRHRGRHPEDARIFAAGSLPRLRLAVRDLCLLLSRGYAPAGSLKLVGDRYGLVKRQRAAVQRAACADQARERREAHRIVPAAASGSALFIDGYNVLTTIEAALADGVLILCRDGTVRDMASIHGSWRRVEETIPALHLLGGVLSDLGAAPVSWYLDSPVSNSGRLCTVMLEVAREQGWPWEVRLVPDPDPLLAASGDVIATADSIVLDRCAAWINLVSEALARRLPDREVLDLAPDT